jgi:hypothetical protein
VPIQNPATRAPRHLVAEELQYFPEPEPLVTWLNVRDFTLGAVSAALVIVAVAAHHGLTI